MYLNSLLKVKDSIREFLSVKCCQKLTRQLNLPDSTVTFLKKLSNDKARFCSLFFLVTTTSSLDIALIRICAKCHNFVVTDTILI